MSAQEVADLMLDATTPAEIAEAKRLAREWLDANPTAPERLLILSAGEQLHMMEGALNAST